MQEQGINSVARIITAKLIDEFNCLKRKVNEDISQSVQLLRHVS